MRVLVARTAERQIERVASWWSAERPAAAALFIEELEETLGLLREVPGAGVRWPTVRRPNLRRILLPRAQTHVYFEVDAVAQVVRVRAIWGAQRGRGPRL